MLARFIRAFLDKYNCEVCRKYQATHGLLCAYCHLDDILAREACQTNLNDAPHSFTAANHSDFMKHESLRA